MADPWFDPVRFGAYFGTIVGGGGGMIGGTLGTLLGILAPQGKGRLPLTIAAWLVCAVGVASLATGIAALALGQPWAIWFPFTLAGVILATVCGSLALRMPQFYQAAEQRRLAAEEIRRGSVG